MQRDLAAPPGTRPGLPRTKGPWDSGSASSAGGRFQEEMGDGTPRPRDGEATEEMTPLFDEDIRRAHEGEIDRP